MSLVLDIVCLLLLVGGFAVGWSRSPLSSGLTLFSAAVALTGAFFLSVPAGSWVSETLVAPLVEQSAANELADMVSAPIFHPDGRQWLSAAVRYGAAECRPFRSFGWPLRSG